MHWKRTRGAEHGSPDSSLVKDTSVSQRYPEYHGEHE